MPGDGARGQNLVHFQNEVFNPYLDSTYQKSFRLGPEVQFRIDFHSVTSDPRVHARGWARGQNLVHIEHQYSKGLFRVC